MMTEMYKKILLTYPIGLFFMITMLFIISEQFVDNVFQPLFLKIGVAEHIGHFFFEIPMLYILLYGPLRQIVRDCNTIETLHKEQKIELLKFAHVIRQSADLVMITDCHGITEYVNDAYPITTGYKKDDFIGTCPGILKSGKHSKEDYTLLWKTILSGNVYHGIIENKRKDNTFYYEEKTITPIRMEGEKITHFVSTGKDITNKVLTEKALQESEYMFKILAESLLTGIFMYQEHYVYVNKAFEEMTGYTADELLMMEPKNLIHPEDRALIRSRIKLRLAGTLQESRSYNELRIIRKDGTFRWVYATIASILYCEKMAELGAMIDISERKEIEYQLEKLATTDKLTSLLNRTRFDEISERETAYVQRYKTPLSLILFDIDYFKKVNDQFGHDTGDSVLVQLAKIGIEMLRGTDIFIRWGGEEFLILCPYSDEDQAYLVAQRLRNKVEQSTFACGSVTISGGVTQYVANESMEYTIKRADLALYKAKQAGRNRMEKGEFASLA